MKSREPKTALITGASSGIGLELARLFARDGYHLVLTARSEETLSRIADDLRKRHNVTVTVIAGDLAEPAAPREIFETLQQQAIAIDVLVNNAGFGTYGPFQETNLDDELQMLQVNVAALTHLTKLFLPAMLQRRRGKILNVASTAAFQPGPLMAVYYATKAYVLSFSAALAEELRGTGVSVTTLCPGPTTSGFQQRAAMESSRLMSGVMMTSADVALAGYEGMKRNRVVVIPGAKNRGLALLAKLLPRRMVVRIVRRAQERIHGA